MFKCAICNKEFENGRKLGGHKVSAHNTRECEICHKNVASRGFKRHLKFHERILIATCKKEKCKKEFVKGYEKQLFCCIGCANSRRDRKQKDLRCAICKNLIDRSIIIGKKRNLCLDCVIKKYFGENVKPYQYLQKKYITLFKLKDEKCAVCMTGTVWVDNYLNLHLHHKNRNRRDNRLKENLEFLCPNCHSQTDNYGFKGRTHSDKTKLKLAKISRDRQEVKAQAS